MTPHGVIYSGDKVVPSFTNDGDLFIKSDDHFRIIAKYREMLEELTQPVKNTKKLVGLSGLAGSGKSTVAKILAEDYGFVRVRFADVLKKMLSTLLREAGLNEKAIEAAVDGDLKEEGIKALNWKTPRHAMQTLGTEWGRIEIGQNLWADITKNVIERLLTQGKKVVVDDIRFQNEVDVIGELGGDTFRVIRTELEMRTIHASEQQTLSENGTILNNGTFADLEDAISKII